ncbi:INO80 complex, subunit Ies4 [Achaetomium macrosporum]|uniref:INO80 complex, subunit Ies4 n=1 Tax=Achaetomium macrosporum TaxID=79813 RepID=A0AAN7CGE4_9PEZI|nr:INO80 complex, subunit Ies4 [Achaetomium macrosporum]
MAPSSKNAAAAKDRRKSSNSTPAASASSALSAKPTRIVTFKVSPEKLRVIVDPNYVKDETPAKQSPAAAPNSNTESASESTPNSPPAGTPAAQSATMGPPTEGPKKKGVKRSAGAAANGNGEPKLRGRPGPKKKQRLDDGTIEGGRGSVAPHKLGPKANQGAINAGLRALDRSGKPCRKWTRGGFKLKSFTGVVWEIPRWTAPPKPRPEASTEGSGAASVDSSNKENKEDASQVKSEASNNGGDIDMQSAPSFAADNSPAPLAIAAN